MAQICIQFHAKKNEIIDFIRDVVDENHLKAYGITIYPEYDAKEIFLSGEEKYENFSEIIVCKNWIEISSKEQYNEYLNEKRGDLIIFIGKDDETELVESSIGAFSSGNIDAFWKKVIAQFKKKLLKGVYVVTPSGRSRYYPKHWYTIGAKEAYERGVAIKPIAGWNRYLLKEENE